MSSKLKYFIAILVIFIAGLLAGYFLTYTSVKAKLAEANQTELAHTILSILAPKELKEIQALAQIQIGNAERKPKDTKRLICGLIEMKVGGLEYSRDVFIGSTIFKDNPKADPFFMFYDIKINTAKLHSVSAGCRKKQG